ncbi:MAG: low affinity iron permease family protein [Crocinitomicaceae bacterium]|jgi:low affinity Fe/Cu permease|nr:low affinity iron permease family protein [Crocinitomicaceae bacterium]
MKTKQEKPQSFFERFSSTVTRATGSTTAFSLALLSIVIWLVSGPIFDFSDTWQLVINTGTTIITFLMVFLIQRTQNKDSLAIHMKLNELIASHEIASNRMVGVEDISEEELIVLRKFYTQLAKMSKKQNSLQESHSIDEAKERHEDKIEHTEPEKAAPKRRKNRGTKKPTEKPADKPTEKRM